MRANTTKIHVQNEYYKITQTNKQLRNEGNQAKRLINEIPIYSMQ